MRWKSATAPRCFIWPAVFFPLAVASVLFGMTNVWVRMTTQRRWRAWVSDAVISRWLKNGRYYQLNLVSGDHQNPEGRLTEDLRVVDRRAGRFRRRRGAGRHCRR